MLSPTTLPALFASLLEESSGRLLSLAPRSAELLQPLAGRVIELRMTPFDFHLYVAPTESALTVLTDIEGAPDAVLIGSPWAFARMGASERPQRGLFGGEVVLEGDISVARRFQALFRNLAIDWEGLLARLTGKAPASWLTGTLRRSHAWRVDCVETQRQNVAEYLQEETRELPASAEAEAYYSDVDALRADSDRLLARIERLEDDVFASGHR